MNYLKYSNLCAGESLEGHWIFWLPMFKVERALITWLQRLLLWRRSFLSCVFHFCSADMVRAAMKEPGKAAAKQRETVYFRTSQWKDGKPINNGMFPKRAFHLAWPVTSLKYSPRLKGLSLLTYQDGIA